MRIVSLLPSATEILCAIGGRDLLVGRSHECDHPAGLDKVPALTGPAIFANRGGASPALPAPSEVDAAVRSRLAEGASLYTLDAGLLAELRPDLILTQDLCRVCSIDLETVRGVAAAMEAPARVLAVSPTTLEGVLDDHLLIGEAAGLEAEAERFVVGLRERLYRAADYVNPFDDGPSVAFLEWTDPLFVAGHWTAQMVERAGARHSLNPTRAVEGSGAAAGPVGVTMRAAAASRAISMDELVASRPEALVIAPCGVELEAALGQARALAEQPWWRGLPAVKRGRVAVVDGSAMFNRPGPRLVDAQEWLTGWLNGRPELAPAGFPYAVVE